MEVKDPRPAGGLASAVKQLLARLLLSLQSRIGRELPGAHWARSQMLPGVIASYERRALVRRIRGQRALVGVGPEWVRRLLEFAYSLLIRNRYLISVAGKTAVACIVIALPLSLFAVARVVLPVPGRVLPVPFEKAPKAAFPVKLAWPYDAAADARAVGTAPVRLVTGQRETLRRARMLDERAPLRLERLIAPRVNRLGANHLRLRVELLGSAVAAGQCTLSVRDGLGRDLGSVTLESRRARSGSAGDWFTRFARRLRYVAIDEDDPSVELQLDADAVPEALLLSAQSSEAPPSTGEARCPYSVSDLLFDWESLGTARKRARLVILASGLTRSLLASAEAAPLLRRLASGGYLELGNCRLGGNSPSATLGAWLHGDGQSLPSLFSFASAAGMPARVVTNYPLEAIGYEPLLRSHPGFHEVVSFASARGLGPRFAVEETLRGLSRAAELPGVHVLAFDQTSPWVPPPWFELRIGRLFFSPTREALAEELARARERALLGEIERTLAGIDDAGLAESTDVILASLGGEVEFPGFLLRLAGAGGEGHWHSPVGISEEALRVPCYVRAAPTQGLRKIPAETESGIPRVVAPVTQSELSGAVSQGLLTASEGGAELGIRDGRDALWELLARRDLLGLEAFLGMRSQILSDNAISTVVLRPLDAEGDWSAIDKMVLLKGRIPMERLGIDSWRQRESFQVDVGRVRSRIRGYAPREINETWEVPRDAVERSAFDAELLRRSASLSRLRLRFLRGGELRLSLNFAAPAAMAANPGWLPSAAPEHAPPFVRQGSDAGTIIVSGKAHDGEEWVLALNGWKLLDASEGKDISWVGCRAGFRFRTAELASFLTHPRCARSWFTGVPAPPSGPGVQIGVALDPLLP